MIKIAKDLEDASMAMQEWFKSQDLSPADAMVVIAYFSARMIINNMSSDQDMEEKIQVGVYSIRECINILKDVKGNT